MRQVRTYVPSKPALKQKPGCVLLASSLLAQKVLFDPRAAEGVVKPNRPRPYRRLGGEEGGGRPAAKPAHNIARSLNSIFFYVGNMGPFAHKTFTAPLCSLCPKATLL